jgi:Fur family ferric uptake transcriptional regulator
MKCCHHPDFEDLTGRLRRRDVKLTRPRRAVLATLQTQHRPLAIKEIFAALRPGECDLASVYRSIRALESAGVVKAFQFGDGVQRYELLAEGDDGHHHHLICTRCANVTEIGECELREIELRLAASKGFRAVTHRLEFFGICPACQ